MQTLAAAMMPVPSAITSKRTTSKKKMKDPSDKPKRPLSSYNIFFRTARASILKNIDQPSHKPRRSHGKIGFADLARTVAEQWKSLDPASRAEFDAKAAEDKERYERELEVWNTERIAKMATQTQESPEPMSEKSIGTSGYGLSHNEIGTMSQSEDYFMPLHTGSSGSSTMPKRVSFSGSSGSSSGSLSEDESLADSNSLFSAGLTRSYTHDANFTDYTPLLSSTFVSLDALASSFDDECFSILSALRQ